MKWKREEDEEDEEEEEGGGAGLWAEKHSSFVSIKMSPRFLQCLGATVAG